RTSSGGMRAMRREGIVPNKPAVTPARNSPIWLDVPMNSELTALTRPRMASGVSSWITGCLITTLSMSDAPITTSMAIDKMNEVDSPNRTVANPNVATAAYITNPTRLVSGQRATTNEQVSAPTAGTARINPSPKDPTAKMSRAKIGSSAVAPAKITANMSSDIAPSTTGLRRTKFTPANSVSNDNGVRLETMRSIGMHQIRTV